MAPDDEHRVPVEFQDSTQQPDRPDEPGGPAVAGVPDSAPADWADPDEEGEESRDTGRRQPSGEGNLLQLPDGAAFGSTDEPSAQERERLLRHAGAVQQEMRDEALAEDDGDHG